MQEGAMTSVVFPKPAGAEMSVTAAVRQPVGHTIERLVFAIICNHNNAV
jgi:hypothetical protein